MLKTRVFEIRNECFPGRKRLVVYVRAFVGLPNELCLIVFRSMTRSLVHRRIYYTVRTFK